MNSSEERRNIKILQIAILGVAVAVLALLLLFPHPYTIEHTGDGTVEPDECVSVSILDGLLGTHKVITAYPGEGMTAQILYDGDPVEGMSYDPRPFVLDFSSHCIQVLFTEAQEIEVDIEVTVDVVTSLATAGIDDEGNPLALSASASSDMDAQPFKIEPVGKVKLRAGDDLTVSITCFDKGCWIDHAAIDGKEVEITDPSHMDLLLENVTENVSVDIGILRYPMITAATDGGATVSPSGYVLVPPGGAQTFVYAPKDGYKVSEVIVDGKEVTASGSYAFSNVREDHSISIRTETVDHIITATSSEGGILTPLGKIVVKDGQSLTFTMTPNDGYGLDTLKVDGIAVKVSGNTYALFNITADHTVSASWKKVSPPTPPTPPTPKYYDLTVEKPTHGQITPVSGKVREGSTVNIVVTPDDGYYVAGIYLDGQKVTGTSTYSFKMDRNHTISAELKGGTVSVKVTERDGEPITPVDLSSYEFSVDRMVPGDSSSITMDITNGSGKTLDASLRLDVTTLSEEFQKQIAISVDHDGEHRSATLFSLNGQELSLGVLDTEEQVRLTVTFMTLASNNLVIGQTGSFTLTVIAAEGSA